jgi:hypothetical protein
MRLFVDQPLEDELEGELHLPATLFVDVARKVAGIVDVAIWS